MTTTEKQLIANQQNGRLGGVKTEEGKGISKYNALKHGLLSKEVLFKGEDEQALLELIRGLKTEIRPSGELENLLTDRIVASMWRLKRLLVIEKATMEWQRERELGWDSTFEKEAEQIKRKGERAMLVNDDIEKLQRYEASIERGIYKALHELQRIQAQRNGEVVQVPAILDVDMGTGQ